MSMLRTDNLKILSSSPLSPNFFLFAPLQLSSKKKNYSHVEKILCCWHLPPLLPQSDAYVYIHTHIHTHTHRPTHTQAHIQLASVVKTNSFVKFYRYNRRLL
jgi:hypothetical protein